MSGRKPEANMADVLKEQRENVLTLAALQAELRSAFKHTQKERGADSTPQILATTLGINWVQARDFLDERRIVKGGAILRKIAAYINRPDLETSILRAADTLPDRMFGMAAVPTDTIHLAFDVFEAYAPYADEFSQAAFAEIFAPHQEIILGVMHHARDALVQLGTTAIAAQVRAQLQTADTGSWMNNKLAIVRVRMQRKIDMFAALMKELRPLYPKMEDLAKALGVHRTLIPTVLRGDMYESTVDRLLGAAIELKSRRATPVVPDQKLDPQPAPPTVDGLGPTLLDMHGGETSPLGIRFVLSPQSFREIEGRIDRDDIAFAARALETARAMLNLFAQIQNPKLRAEIRRTLSGEVEEIELAIRLFTSAHPNRLTSLYAAQRETWARDARGEKAQ